MLWEPHLLWDLADTLGPQMLQKAWKTPVVSLESRALCLGCGPAGVSDGEL
jgi:hypothetical protein